MHVSTGLQIAGKDATQDFEEIGHSNSAREMLAKYYIGDFAVRVAAAAAAGVPTGCFRPLLRAAGLLKQGWLQHRIVARDQANRAAMFEQQSGAHR